MLEVPKELVAFYESLEGINSIDIWDLQSNLKHSEKIDGEWRERLIVDRKVLFLNLNNGQLVQNVQVPDVQGQLYKSLFSEKEIQWLKDRLNATQNLWLKSRYAHLLWQEVKHTKYAEVAIDNYINAIKSLESDRFHEIPNFVDAVIYISNKSKRRDKQTQEFVSSLIKGKPIFIKANVLNSILRFQFLNIEHRKVIADRIPTWIEQNDQKSYHAIKGLLEQGLVLYHKLSLPENKLYELLAENEDIILELHSDESDFIRLTTIGEKAQYLKLAKKTEESERFLAEYNRLKQKVKFHRISSELDDEGLKMFNDYLNMKSKVILDMPTADILTFFAIDDGILVDPDENKQKATEAIKDSILHGYSVINFDINTNFKNLSDSEKIDMQVIESYTLSHGIRFHSLFMKVFTEGILSGKLNYYKIFRYFENQTWYGVKFRRDMTDNEIDENSSWLTMLAPSIHNLFAQFELSVLMSTNKINNLILAIDSMTVKFEGALRDFIKLRGGNTTTTKNEQLTEELLDDLLENPTTKRYFSNKDIELFKYTFTKKGKNLRNDVAHSFMHFSSYTWEAAVLVFLCIHRLGKYTVQLKNN
jgi:hypothetical protein